MLLARHRRLAIIAPVKLMPANSLSLLFHLHALHALDRLFFFDALLLPSLEHFLVFHPKLTTTDVEAIEGSYNGIGLLARAEVCKCQPAKDALIEVIVESIGHWDLQILLCEEKQTISFGDKKKFLS